MAYVPGFLHDVFISYACADDAQDGLIRHFHTLLTKALAGEGLKIKDAAGPEGVEVFLDNRSIESGSDLTEQVLTSARSAAVFVALHSTAYLASSWCSREAEEFTSNYDPRRPRLDGRLFVASLGQKGGPAESPVTALHSRRFRRFFYLHENGKDFPFDPADPAQENPDGYTFKEEARMWAREIADTLKAMRGESPAPGIFLADTSPERAPHAEDIKKWLLQKQMRVLRGSGHGEDWETKNRALIGQADLFVDLYETAPSAAGLAQAKMATELGKKRVRWLPQGELSADAAQQAMQETLVIEETLEDFKAGLLALLVQPGERHKPPPPPVSTGQGAPDGDAMVLLVGATEDLPCLQQIEKRLDELGYGRDAFLSEDIIATPDGWRSGLLELIDFHKPNGVIFVDGQCAGDWRDRRLRDLLLLVKDAAPGAKPALCTFPPPDKSDRRYNPRPSQVVRIDHQQLEKLGNLLSGTE